MRELNLAETGGLAVLLLFSLVLPILMSGANPRDAAGRKACLKWVWIGQSLLALTGLLVLASAALAPWAVLFAVVSCFGCARKVRQASNALHLV